MAKKSNKMEIRLQELSDYLNGVEIKGNLYIVKVAYPDKWIAYPSPNGLINAARGETIENTWFYYANIGEVELNDMFDLIEDTIKENMSAARKVEVLRQKMYELKEIFNDRNNSLEKLESVKFVFDIDKPKKRTSKRANKKEVESNNIDNNEE